MFKVALLSLLGAFAIPFVRPAQVGAPLEEPHFQLTAETVDRGEGDTLLARGDAVLTLDGLTVRADEIQVQRSLLLSGAFMARALGNVVLRQGRDSIRLHRLSLDLGTGRGEFELMHR